jgi:hypothetical protein
MDHDRPRPAETEDAKPHPELPQRLPGGTL